MKKSLSLLVLALTCLSAMCQIDTIYAIGKVIACNVIDVGAESVKFSYPNETATNSLYVNAVKKIVFRSGRQQEFAAQSSFRVVKGPSDWENVTLSSLESEIKGLYKLGEVSAKAKGTTAFSNQERVKMRAIRKLKMDAAMMGANTVYVYNMRSDGNHIQLWSSGIGLSAETSISGISYTNSPISFADVKKAIASSEGQFTVTTIYSLHKGDADMEVVRVSLKFSLDDAIDESGTSFLLGTIDDVKANRFQVVFMGDREIFVRHTDKSTVYVYKIIL